MLKKFPFILSFILLLSVNDSFLSFFCKAISEKSAQYCEEIIEDEVMTVGGYVTFIAANEGVLFKNTGSLFFNDFINRNHDSTVKHPVSLIEQNPELPEGCEVTSLAMCLNYRGYNVDKCDLADNYLPKSKNIKDDPEYVYLFNPRSDGFYCYATCLGRTIDNYNAENGTNISYTNLTGNSTAKLYEQLYFGNPCIVWGTIEWQPPETGINGLYMNLHCMVLLGCSYDKVYLADPIYGYTEVDKSTFETIWTQMGSRAMVIN